jgi:hypothetical protein
MKRHLATFGLVALMAIPVGGCRSSEECNLCPGYCDDSGCYACTDDDTCWPVDNQPCNGGTQCGANEYCADWGCARVCSFDEDCAIGEQCLPAGYCGPEDDVGTPCETHADCGNGMFCHDGLCEEGCQSDDDCPGDEVCAACGECQPPDNPVCGEYKELCETSADCGADRDCNDLGRCAYECDGADPTCPLGQVCESGLCVDDPAPSSPECLTAADCDAVSHCTANGCLCVNTYCQPLCEIDDDCLWGQFCHLGVCKADYRPEE